MRLISVLTSSLLILLLSVSAAFADGQKATSDLLDVLKAKGVLDDASYDSLKKNETASPTPAASTLQLLDVLKAKGVLNQEDYNRLSAEVPQASPTAVPAVATNPAPAAVPVAETVTAPAPEQATAATPGGPERPIDGALTKVEDSFARVTGDIVRLKIGGYLQAGYLNDDAGFSYGAPPNNLFSPTSGNQFFVRRARLVLDFGVGPKVGARVSIEPAVDLNTASTTSGGRSILRDAYGWTDYIPYTRITIGQFKTPFGLEGVESLSDNPTINRSMVTNLVHYPLLRDIGVMASWNFKTDVSGLPLGAQWAVALVNGTGYNLPDDNDQKDLVFRGTVNPLVEGLNIGGSLYGGKTHVAPTAGAALNKYHDSWAAEAEYIPPFLKGLKLRGEYLWNRQYYTKFYSYASVTGTANNAPPANLPVVPSGDTLSSFTGNRTVHTAGWYALAVYRIEGLQGFGSYLNGLEPLVRYDTMNEDEDGSQWLFTSVFKKGAVTQPAVITRVGGHDRYRTTVGMNYYFNNYARLMLNYEMIHVDAGLRTASIESIDLISHRLFTTVLQVKF